MSRRTHFARFPALSLLIALALALPVGCTDQATVVTPPPTGTPIEIAIASPTAEPTLEITASPVPTEAATPVPTVAPTPVPTVWLPDWTPLPPTTSPTKPPPTDGPSPDPTDAGGLIAVPTGNSVPTRVVVAALHIDLPVIYGKPGYPVCNVAMYLANFVNPGQPGSTYLYAHARTGMFLSLLNQSKVNNGAAMIGMLVKVYTKDRKLHLYRINIVKRHATDFSLALNLKKGQHRLILQTSEGPAGTVPKLQVAAKPIGVYKSTAAAALPTPHPRKC